LYTEILYHKTHNFSIPFILFFGKREKFHGILRYFVVFKSANTWEQRKVGDIVKSHNAGIYISKENYGSGVNIIGVGNIYDSDCVDGEIYRFAPVDDERFILDENDLIYGESSLVPEGIARTMYVTKKAQELRLRGTHGE